MLKHVFSLSDFVDDRLTLIRADTTWHSRVLHLLQHLRRGMDGLIASLPEEAYIASLLDPRYLDTFIPPARRAYWWGQLQGLVDAKVLLVGGADEVEDAPPPLGAPPVASPYGTRSTPRLPLPAKRSYDDIVRDKMKAKGATQAASTPYRDRVPMNSPPLLWWKTHESIYPIHAALAKRYLAIPATSAPCERLFSISGRVLEKRRASLSPEATAAIVFVHEHVHLLDGINLDIVHFEDD